MFLKREERKELVLTHEEVVLLRKVLLYTRNKLISEDKPIDDINNLILKLY